MSNNIFKIKGKVQHYAWGGFQFIPSILQQSNSEYKPFAEYWLGAHPSAPATIDGEENLLQQISDNKEKFLGKYVVDKFNELPYLLKILDVKEMLSIQVHPSKTESIKGFEAEEKANIDINATNRNYKDKNHKPEVMIALSEFWLLHGFKSLEEIEKNLQDIAEFTILLPIFKKEGLKSLYQFIMQMPQEQIDTILLPLVKKEIRKKKNNELNKGEAGWWVAKLYEDTNMLKNLDKGIFSIYLFNLVELQKGQAIFQGAGVPHAYLEGQNVELMANSDNVLRGGLTPKYIDVNELMKHTLFEAVTPTPITILQRGVEKIYPVPVDDFGISLIDLQAGETYQSSTNSLEILLVLEGAIIIKNLENMIIKKGDAIAIVANTNYHITATGKTSIYKAYVPSE